MSVTLLDAKLLILKIRKRLSEVIAAPYVDEVTLLELQKLHDFCTQFIEDSEVDDGG